MSAPSAEAASGAFAIGRAAADVDGAASTGAVSAPLVFPALHRSNVYQGTYGASYQAPMAGVIKPSLLPTAAIRPTPIVRERADAGDGFVSPTDECRASAGPFRSLSALTNHSSAMDARLKVEDALSYLDQVKMQFSNRPQVYSDFLDIMKDFKSQTIDTPGVIARVSGLFRGRSNLIVGFNTFLPPGYKIEVDGDRISISTPNGGSRVISDTSQSDDSTDAAQPQPFGSPASAKSAASTDAQPYGPRIEFNHAINYVNKIKSRFTHRPEVYKQFLEILHSYQKEQRDLKQGLMSERPVLTETEVYASVAKLFHGEPDLLKQFGQFLPDATGCSSILTSVAADASLRSPTRHVGRPIKDEQHERASSPPPPPPLPSSPSGHKRPLVDSKDDEIPAKLPAFAYAVDFAEATKFGTMEEFQFFDKVRKAVGADDVYDNFLRCLLLYNQDLISKGGLVDLVSPFLKRHPELLKWLRDFMGFNERSAVVEAVTPKMDQLEQQGISSDLAMEIDYATCRRHGVSYRALPDSYKRPYCSGRSPLIADVLNDTWVSFPSWSSEDSSFVSSKKSQFEECIYRTEDERFELDIVIEVNTMAVHALEALHRKLQRLGADEVRRYRLDDSLGGRSTPLMWRALRRVYGDKATEIALGLQRNALVAVPLVLKRLRAKDTEWRDAQKNFNRVWREQNQKYHLKSLDQQDASFKQSDMKLLRSKTLLNQIEVLYDERREKMEDGSEAMLSGPQMELKYPTNRSIIYDVTDILIHHTRRHTGIQKEEKWRIKRLLRQVIPQLFGLQCEAMSDDEQPKNDSGKTRSLVAVKLAGTDEGARVLRRSGRTASQCKSASQPTSTEPACRSAQAAVSSDFSLLFASNAWYVFLRLQQLACERLDRLRRRADELAAEEMARRKRRADTGQRTAAESLNVEQKPPVEPRLFYSELVGQIKKLLDQQVDAAQYEDSLRQMFTIDAYVAFTMDKIVHMMVRQLQMMVSDELNARLLALYERHRPLGGAGGSALTASTNGDAQTAYQEEAEHLSGDQNCFKMFFLGEVSRVTVELLDTGGTDDDGDAARAEWSAYVQHFADAIAANDDALLGALCRKPIMLARHAASPATPPFTAPLQQPAPPPAGRRRHTDRGVS